MGGVLAVVNESDREINDDINDTCERSAKGSLRWEEVGEEIYKICLSLFRVSGTI